MMKLGIMTFALTCALLLSGCDMSPQGIAKRAAENAQREQDRKQLFLQCVDLASRNSRYDNGYVVEKCQDAARVLL